MSKAQLGRRLNTQRQDILALEKREESGAVTLRTLREVADALDAELFYAIVPRNSLTQMMVSQAHRKALSELAQVAHLMRLEDQEVGKEETARQLKERTDELLRSRSRALWDTRQP
jgi:predicted DNA-binding mobile mystery protein A